MKRNVSNKIYEIALLATGLLAIFNLVGVWVTWNTGNPVGYVAGTLEIVGLAACGVLAFLNEKVVVRKQWFAWAACFILHILFFVLCITLTSLNSKDNAVPALFTVLLICIMLVITFVLLKDRVIIKRKPYTFTPETVKETGDTTPNTPGEIASPTVQIKVDEQVDKTPDPEFKPSFVDLPKENPSKDDEEQENSKTTGVITL